jgi:DHA2 family methylenomycin A resistance protein-like MFS transporter
MATDSNAAVRAEPAAATERGRGLLLFGLALGYFMVLMDTTIVNIALPAIGTGLHGGLSSLQWVTNGYTLTFASLLLSAGALSDRFGGRRVFLAGCWSFGVLSAVCAASVNLPMLITLRALLGVSGALLLPSSLAIVANSFSDPKKRARALGNWAAITGIALVAGPVVGGVLVDVANWRWIFIVNVPIAIAAIAIVGRSATETTRRPDRGFDVAGQLAAVLALAAITYGMIRAESSGWGSPVVIASLAVFALATIGFVVNETATERRGGAAVLPFALVRNRTFSASLFAGLVVNFAISGVLFTLSLFYQSSRGYSTLVAGLAFLPLTLPTAINPIFSGRLVAKIGPRKPATLGLLLLALGTASQAFTTSNSAAATAVGLVGLAAVGFGVSYALPALVAGLLSSVPGQLAGTASGAMNSARQTGAVVGVAVLGAVLGAAKTTADGTRVAMIIAAALMLLGALVVATFVGRPAKPAA